MLPGWMITDNSENDPELSSGDPTHHEPGSQEKIEVLRRRLESGQYLWHDHDFTRNLLRLPNIDRLQESAIDEEQPAKDKTHHERENE
jgi:hypothetical protein